MLFRIFLCQRSQFNRGRCTGRVAHKRQKSRVLQRRKIRLVEEEASCPLICLEVFDDRGVGNAIGRLNGQRGAHAVVFDIVKAGIAVGIGIGNAQRLHFRKGKEFSVKRADPLILTSNLTRYAQCDRARNDRNIDGTFDRRIVVPTVSALHITANVIQVRLCGIDKNGTAQGRLAKQGTLRPLEDLNIR